MGRLRRIKNDVEKVKLSPYYLLHPVHYNDKINYLEVGMGKGNFIISQAVQNPFINYYGIDKYPTILIKAENKLKGMNLHLENLKFSAIDLININRYFPNNFFNKIYINFCDPWPKKSHVNRRLTSPNFLLLYKKILRPHGIVDFKTDNDMLYKYTIDTLTQLSEVKFLKRTNDFYRNKKPNDFFLTEYEKKFINMKIKIKFISFMYCN